MRAYGLADRHFNATTPADEKQLDPKIVEAMVSDRKAVGLIGKLLGKGKRDSSLSEPKLAKCLDTGFRHLLEFNECARCSGQSLNPQHTRQTARAIEPFLRCLSLFLRWWPSPVLQAFSRAFHGRTQPLGKFTALVLRQVPTHGLGYEK